MSNIMQRRLARIEERYAPDLPSLWVAFVCFDSPPGLPFVERCRLRALQDQVNAHAEALIAEHGPAVQRHHPYRNDALGCLAIADLDWLDGMLSDDGEGVAS
jgi:hypothetical protein